MKRNLILILILVFSVLPSHQALSRSCSSASPDIYYVECTEKKCDTGFAFDNEWYHEGCYFRHAVKPLDDFKFLLILAEAQNLMLETGIYKITTRCYPSAWLEEWLHDPRLKESLKINRGVLSNMEYCLQPSTLSKQDGENSLEQIKQKWKTIEKQELIEIQKQIEKHDQWGKVYDIIGALFYIGLGGLLFFFPWFLLKRLSRLKTHQTLIRVLIGMFSIIVYYYVASNLLFTPRSFPFYPSWLLIGPFALGPYASFTAGLVGVLVLMVGLAYPFSLVLIGLKKAFALVKPLFCKRP